MADAKTTAPSVDYMKKGSEHPMPPPPRQEMNMPMAPHPVTPPTPPAKAPYRD